MPRYFTRSIQHESNETNKTSTRSHFETDEHVFLSRWPRKAMILEPFDLPHSGALNGLCEIPCLIGRYSGYSTVDTLVMNDPFRKSFQIT